MLEKRVLVTGASGYVGGRLLPRLEQRGLPVRCLARRPEFLAGRVGPRTEVVQGDVLCPETLAPALEGVHTAYYMVHSMGSAGSEGFEARDRLGAENMHAAGMDPEGLPMFLSKLIELHDREPSGLEYLFSTHPPTTERVDRVQMIIAGLPIQPHPSGFSARFHEVQEIVKGMQTPPVDEGE